LATVKAQKTDRKDTEELLDKEKEQKNKNTAKNKSAAILEKGIIYFFFRGRVEVEDPRSIEDIARSYIVLRPFPFDVKAGTNALDFSNKARLLVLPKKMLPKKHGTGFLAIVEKSASMQDLRQEFSSSEYVTKASGTRHVPAATPVAEGVYTIISKSQRSHLVYQITFPSIGEVQRDFGLFEKGSYIVSAKNPKFPGPSNMPVAHPPLYPESIQMKFRGLRWIPLTPKLLDYTNTQLLLIGEGLGVMRRTAELERDHEDLEGEMKELAKEDRMAHLEEHDPVFTEMDLISQEHRKIQTTWE